MNILIVDDKNENIYFLNSLLSASGYNIMSASNGKEALELLNDHKFALIISDILMPVMDGFELCRLVKSDPKLKTIPFIFYTATYTEKKDEEFALKLGASKFIVKPQEPDVFLGMVNEIINSAKNRTIEVHTPVLKNNETIYKLYNERLINKLEKKIQDLDEERNKRRKYEKEVKMLAQAVKSVREAICVTNLDGKIIFVNEAFEKIYGYKKYELYGRNIGIIRSPENKKNIKDTITQDLKKSGWQGELHQLKKDGTEFPALISISIVRDDNNKDIALILVSSDLTERRALEEQYRQAQKMEAIGRLAGGVAHDFNNILTVITGYSELLLQKLNKNDPMFRPVKEIFKAGANASVLTRQLLTFSRKQILNPIVLDINDIIRELDKMLRRLIGENIEFNVLLNAKNSHIKADPGQVEQVIMNLVINAKDAMPLGGKLTLETKDIVINKSYIWENKEVKAGDYVMFAVSDTGIGMDKDTLSKIFEPFFTTKKEGKGTGLGLSTVYGIVRQSGGFINVYSEREKGTSFKIYFPCVNELPQKQLRNNTSAKLLKGSETVLVVEDEDTLRNLVAGVLRDNGYNVLEAPNGGSALLKCEQYKKPIDLILTDVIMPEMSGRELVERLIKIHPEMKVLYMSGYTDDAIIQHDVLDENTAFLQKPFSPLLLLENVRKLLDSKVKKE